MTSLHALITALVRLLGLFYVVKALDNAAAPFFYLAQVAATAADSEFQIPNPWMTFLPMVAFYVIIAVVIFFTAPRIARLVIPKGTGDAAETHWHESLLFCTGALIFSWAFIRITDTVYLLVASAANNDGEYSFDDAMLIYLFMTAILLGAGFLLIAKFHRISSWMVKRRETAKALDTNP